VVEKNGTVTGFSTSTAVLLLQYDCTAVAYSLSCTVRSYQKDKRQKSRDLSRKRSFGNRQVLDGRGFQCLVSDDLKVTSDGIYLL
jgi:hypothetical protein